MEEEMEEETKYPITRDDCPNCQSKERLGQEAIKKLQADGKLSKQMYNEGLLMQIPLPDTTRPPILLGPTVKIPVILIYWGVCKECQTMYCTKFNLITQEVPVQMKKMPSQGPPGQFSPS